MANRVSIAVAALQIEIDKFKEKLSFLQFYKNIQVKDLTRVQDNLKDFTGREWIVDEIFNWLESDQRQFFILIQDPRSR